jgi:phage tail tape-measure protein
MAPEIAQYGMQQFARGAVGELSGAAAGARLGEGFGPYGAVAGGLLGAAMVGSQAGQQTGDYLQASLPDNVMARHQVVSKPRGKPWGGPGWFGDGPW